MKVKISHVVSLLLIITSSSFVRSQNFLYNTEQFGIRGAMLGGSITAGANDESMTFYNPAGIHKVPSQVSISLFQPSVRTFGFNNFWGINEKSEINENYGLKPSLISFKFKLDKLDFAFIKISKSQLSDSFNAKREEINNTILNTQYFEYEYKGEDDWFGAGTSFKITPEIYVGVSQFLSITNFEYKNRVIIEERDRVNNNNNTDSFFNSEQTSSFDNTGFITKLGFLYDTDQHDIGLTITTPKYLRILEGGYYTRTLTNIDNTQNIGEQILDNNLSPAIKTPWEFSLGYSYSFKKQNKLWLNVDYYSGISEYKVATISSGSRKISWVNGNKDVFNIGVGYSHVLNDKLELSGGLRTNNFAYKNKPVTAKELRNTILDGNHIHFVVGTRFKFKRHNVLLGLDWGTLYDTPDEIGFQYLRDIGKLTPNLKGLTKQNISVLLTYRFILDELIKL
ncbi:hypothetical protein BTO06_06915 [Tenacibaculum sp. SZ-18]|uniref:OmpP1/FadL family transporter n=1 Tax=Tenacibaculum sp. SZ-18 TaxID=754423 RepID=UPI000C2D05DD|nr:outer membrane protein transport protein [Tenacibaculum sp. SZ-18]AUC14882.1 hypothetical protein BTO06_06915 [Tenacibaculum sp. SZ-18]